MDNKSLSHTKWKCQYHIVFIPKYRMSIPIKMSTFFGNSEHPFPEK